MHQPRILTLDMTYTYLLRHIVIGYLGLGHLTWNLCASLLYFPPLARSCRRQHHEGLCGPASIGTMRGHTTTRSVRLIVLILPHTPAALGLVGPASDSKSHLPAWLFGSTP